MEIKDKKSKQTMTAAASIMGQKGGATVSEKKLATLRATGLKMRGKSKHRRTLKEFTSAKEEKLKAAAKTIPIKLTIRNAACELGKIGGMSRSEKKVAAVRRNALMGGRPLKYEYKKRTVAKMGMGIRHPQIDCIIPDVVVKNPLDFKKKYFAAFDAKGYTGDGKGTRYKVCVDSLDEHGFIIMKRIGGGRKDKKTKK